jgi:hypothetical protein
LVVEDSPIFSALAASTVRMGFPHSSVLECHSYEEAAILLTAGHVDALVCGYGLGEGKTAHDLREISDAPMVVLTGRLAGVVPPRGACVVEKIAGPGALQLALEGALAH